MLFLMTRNFFSQILFSERLFHPLHVLLLLFFNLCSNCVSVYLRFSLFACLLCVWCVFVSVCFFQTVFLLLFFVCLFYFVCLFVFEGGVLSLLCIYRYRIDYIQSFSGINYDCLIPSAALYYSECQGYENISY